ncbi:MAG: GNAT family N-acetyltransferase [Rhodobacteraceae bacterium]|nr:GNAT family N-acetyltransferase [Paracoccaceae bacterium]MCW9042455.1 GNAT family N-acetyltransferase [Pseudopelagicola sp.]
MIRKAEENDIPAMMAFLEGRIASSMFLLGNLERFSIDNRDHPYGTAFFLRETGDGITGIFGATNGGMLLCQLPGIGATEAQTYAHLLQGYVLRGMTGEAEQVATILEALPFEAEALRVNDVDPLYMIELAQVGESDAVVRAPGAEDKALLTEWFRQMDEDNGLGEGGDMRPLEVRAEEAIASEVVWILEGDDGPVAMSAVNAHAGHAVQIGGVFVRRDRRGQGLAAQVVTAQLAELREEGFARAILFAGSDTAARVYEKIGFQRVGEYRVALLADPVPLGALR